MAPLFYVSLLQIDYQVPAGTANGPVTVTITNADGRVSVSAAIISPAAPSLFTFNQSGTGHAAALDAITFASPPFAAIQAGGEPNIIAFYGTGLGAEATDVDGNVNATVQATLDGKATVVEYAGRTPGYVGLNQLP